MTDTQIVVAVGLAIVVLVVAGVWWLEQGDVDDAWARSPERKRGVARWVDARPWAVGDRAWHHDRLVSVVHVYPQERLVKVKDGLGVEYPVMTTDLRRVDARRAA